MSARSNFLLGDNVFIKLVSLNEERGQRLVKALVTNTDLPPFTSNEFLFSYLAKDEKLDINIPNNTLLTPDTQVLVSAKKYNLDYFDQYKNKSYSDTVSDLKRKFTEMSLYLKNIKPLASKGKTIKTALIISRIVTGNYDQFIKDDKTDYKDILDSLIHIMYLHFTLQNKYQTVHGDPKTQNYTWKKLKKPVNITYDFRDEYNHSNSMLIKRKNVKNVFYMTDLEFVYSPILKTIDIDDNKYYFNFKIQIGAYGSTKNNVYVPKITEDENSVYKYNQNIMNLYGGYNIKPKETMYGSEGVYEWFGDNFPRMFTIDILTLVEMLLLFYPYFFDGELLRKINIYFTQFVSLSHMEKDPYRRDKSSYKRVSPATFAMLLNS